MAMVSGPRVFFDIIGTFQAARLIKDVDAQMAVVESLMLDAVDGVRQSLMGIGETISGIVDQILPLGIALSEATIEFEKFAGQNKELAAEIIDTGAAFGFTAEQALSAGSRMAQLSAVVGEAATATATELGQQFALISGMGTEEAMQRMINLQQQTGFMYGDLTAKQFKLLDAENQRKTVMGNTLEILDQLNTVENRSAANLKQITFVMNQFAAQAHQTGESMAMMAAMSATLIEAGEEQGKAGRALRMIYARLGSNIQNNNDLLKQYGIETKNASGALRPMSEIVLELANVFPQLTAEQRQNIVQTVAGNDHYVRFVKLIQNSTRMTELHEDAMNNQATAQEEVNRVTEDASTKYKEALADLEHVQAQMGQGLLPTMTEFVKFQTRINVAFMELSTIPMFGKMGVFVVQMQNYLGAFGKVFDMMMQIKSVSIAMKTYNAVLRAVGGEELIRTDNLKNAKNLSLVGLDIQQEQLVVANLINAKQMEYNELLEIQGVKIDMADQKRIGIANREQILNDLVHERNVLLDRQINRRTELAALQMTATAMAEGERNAIRTLIVMNKTLTDTQRMRLGENIDAVEKQLTKEHLLAVTLERKIHARSAHFESTKEKNKIELKETQVRINKAEGELSVLRRIRIEDELGILAKEEMISVDARAAMLNEEIIMQMESLGMEKKELMFLTIAEIEAIAALTAVRGGLSEAEAISLFQKKMLIIEERKLLTGVETQTVAIHRMSAAYNGLGMMSGVLSMAVGTLGHHIGLTDDANESMRISMILMTMSMIPAIIQMGIMTAQMMGIKTMADLAAFSIMGMNAALSVTLVLTGVGAALVFTALAIGSLVQESTEAIVAVDGMNASLAATGQLLADMSLEESQSYTVPEGILAAGEDFPETIDLTTMSLQEFNDALALSSTAMGELLEDQSIYAADDPFYSMIQNDINALVEFESVLKQGAIAEFGEQIKGLSDSQKISRTLDALNNGMITGPNVYAPEDASFGGEGFDLARYTKRVKTGTKQVEVSGQSPVSDMPGGQAERTKQYETVNVYEDQEMIIETTEELLEALNDGTIKMSDLTNRGREFFLQMGNNAIMAADTFYQNGGIIDGIDAAGDGFTTAEEKMRSFANAREELFFGGKSSNLTGDMMKQVVNKGVENLYSNVELVMTNNFNGITIGDAIEQVTSGVMSQLVQAGVPLNSAGV